MIGQCDYLTDYGACEYKSNNRVLTHRGCGYDLVKYKSNRECEIRKKYDNLKGLEKRTIDIKQNYKIKNE